MVGPMELEHHASIEGPQERLAVLFQTRHTEQRTRLQVWVRREKLGHQRLVLRRRYFLWIGDAGQFTNKAGPDSPTGPSLR